MLLNCHATHNKIPPAASATATMVLRKISFENVGPTLSKRTIVASSRSASSCIVGPVCSIKRLPSLFL